MKLRASLARLINRMRHVCLLIQTYEQVLYFTDLWHKCSSEPDQPGSAQLLQSLTCHRSRPSLLPEFGDAALAIDCLLKVRMQPDSQSVQVYRDLGTRSPLHSGCHSL